MAAAAIQPAEGSSGDRSLYSSRPAWKAHLGLVALVLAPLAVRIPPSLNVITTASLAVYAGCWRSVKEAPPPERMSKEDAMRFPLMGSAVLLGLFLALKFLPKELVNLVLVTWMSALAVLVLTSALLPYGEPLFPPSLRHKSLPLPRLRIPHLLDTATEPVSLSVPTLALGSAAAAFCAWYITKRHWLANNVLGCALSLEGLEYLNLGSVHVGVILMGGLFVYDCFWVFCTPVMVSVAKNFDAPIKLLFPRAPDPVTGKIPFSMLGLGDIVIPGVFVALMLRMDVVRGRGRSTYFRTALAGYVAGLGTTLAVMNAFNAAQPALLYIVPAVLGAVALHAARAGELVQVFNYVEPVSPEAGDDADAGQKGSSGNAAGDGGGGGQEEKKDQ